MPSTVIVSFHYSATSRELTVVFQTGRRYTYVDVPQEIHAAMKASFSKGGFFNREIRGRFAFRRLDDIAA